MVTLFTSTLTIISGMAPPRVDRWQVASAAWVWMSGSDLPTWAADLNSSDPQGDKVKLARRERYAGASGVEVGAVRDRRVVRRDRVTGLGGQGHGFDRVERTRSTR
jgi:hypothetical protein